MTARSCWSLVGGSFLFIAALPARSETLFGSGFAGQSLDIQEEVGFVSEALSSQPLDPTQINVREIVINSSFVDLVSAFRNTGFSSGGFSLPGLMGLLNNPLGSGKSFRTFKPGSCYFSFLENCIKGPYVSLGFVSSSSVGAVSSPYSRSSSYISNGSSFQIDTSYNISSTGTISGSGGEIALGYDHGGIRNELSLSTLSSAQTIAVDDGIDTVTTGWGGRASYSYGAVSGSGIGFSPAAPITANLSKKSILAKTSVDIPTSTRLVPYIGFGIGISMVDVSPVSFSTGLDVCTALDAFSGRPGTFSPCPAVYAPSGGTATLFLGQIHAGVSYFINNRLSVYVQGAYDYNTSATAGDIKLSSGSSYSGSSGIRFKL